MAARLLSSNLQVFVNIEGEKDEATGEFNTLPVERVIWAGKASLQPNRENITLSGRAVGGLTIDFPGAKAYLPLKALRDGGKYILTGFLVRDLDSGEVFVPDSPAKNAGGRKSYWLVDVTGRR